jgi:ADP-ribose pyrophosphatase YjhB (NUDIX family)
MILAALAASAWLAQAVSVARRETGVGRVRAAEVVAVVADVEPDPRLAGWLVAHAIVESSLRRDVQDCRVLGAHGDAGLWQMSPRAPYGAPCGDLRGQALGAARRLRWCASAGIDLGACWGGMRVERRRKLAEEMWP